MGFKLDGIIIFKCESEIKDNFVDPGNTNVDGVEYFFYFVVSGRDSGVFYEFLDLECDDGWVFLFYDWEGSLIDFLFEV